jgi:lipase maturation factor 1
MESLFTQQGPAPRAGWAQRFEPVQRWLSPWSDPAPYQVSRWVFLRLLGSVYLCAFLSLWVQLDGLIGSGGILPAERFLELARTQLDGRMHLLPTLLWFGASDSFLHLLTGAGTLLAVLLTVGIAPAPSLALLWVLYLSLSLGGQTFFSFQWDTLLLEAGFLAIWLAPLTVSPSAERRAPVRRPALWLLWWLLFRLMFESAAVKLSSGDPAWAGLTALRYHFETQPLPTWVGWYAHQLPAAVLWFLTAAVFVIEGLVPFLMFGGNRLRRVACAALVTLQVVILATGNYCFFNLLAIGLSVLLLDDAAWPARLRRWVVTAAGPKAARREPRSWPGGVLMPVAVALFVASLAPTAGLLGLGLPGGDTLFAAYRWLQPFRTINSYGLFAVMTTERPEIIVEGTSDGNNWQPYQFRYKPGDLRRPPGFVAPHQPRLDWQMWFAALGSVEQNPWFLHFLQALLRGSPAVGGLLETNPFPDKPPLAVRAVEYDYHFTNLESRAATGDWWTRQNRREYCPAVRLNAEGELVLFEAVPLLPAASAPAQ